MCKQMRGDWVLKSGPRLQAGVSAGTQVSNQVRAQSTGGPQGDRRWHMNGCFLFSFNHYKAISQISLIQMRLNLLKSVDINKMIE